MVPVAVFIVIPKPVDGEVDSFEPTDKVFTETIVPHDRPMYNVRDLS